MKQFLFNKRLFLSLIVDTGVFTFVPYSNSRMKQLPMDEPNTASFYDSFKPTGLKGWLLMLLVMMAGIQLFGQGWERNFGGNADDIGHAIIQTKDHGYVAAGFSESFGSDGDMDVYVIRTDVDGTKIWEKTYDDGHIEHGYSIIETQDNGFLVVGDIRTTQLSDPNIYLLKIDHKGKKIWSKQFGGAGNDVGFRIIPAPISGGYLIVGSTTSFGNGENEVFLLKIDEQGNQVWSKNYGTPGDDYGRSAIEVSDGFLVTGLADVNGGDLYLLKVGFDGAEVWSKFFGIAGNIDEGYDLLQAADGNVVIAGYYDLTQAWVLKVTPAGDQVWSTTLGGNLIDQAFDLLQTSDGNFVIAGVTEITAANANAFLAAVDGNGNELWFEDIGRGSHLDWGQAVAPTEDGGFIVTGYNSLFGSSFNDLTLIKTGASGLVYTNHLTGKVFKDGGDCALQQTETGLNDWIIQAASGSNKFFGTTDANGNFDIILDTGDYVVTVLVKNAYWDACIAAYNVNFNSQYDTLVRNFPMLPMVECPLLEVDVSAPSVQNCSNIGYVVSFCNTGTVAASTPSLEVILGQGLNLTTSSIPVASNNDSLYVFNLPALGLDECGVLNLTVASDCSGVPAQAYTVSAHILPDSICLPPASFWDFSDVKVNGYCDSDSVRFVITNEGTGSMSQPLNFIVIEDDVLLREGMFELGTGQDSVIAQSSATGATYRIIAEQAPGHPGNSYPTIAVEGCTTGAPVTTGFTTMFQEDENDPFVSIDVQEGISSTTDYIFLRGYPKGYLKNGENLIPANTDIEYHVYFQNAGTDTITRLVIRDTLSETLEIGTVRAGASNFAYDFEAYNNGVLKFTFDSILLLPGGGAGSQGFVKFTVAQKADNPIGTVIPNSATVYSGFDAPFQTATYEHVVGEGTPFDFVLSDVSGPLEPGVRVDAYPNPFVSAIVFEIKGRSFNNLTVNIFDISGQLLRREKASGHQLLLQRGELPTGCYAYQLEGDGKLIQTGKMIVR